MTAKQLIAKLKKMPQDLEVGFSSHDNSDHEVQGWAGSVCLVRKEDFDYLSEFDAKELHANPDEWITIRC